MPLRCLALIAFVSWACSAGPGDIPPASLVRENLRRATMIVKGRIQSVENPHAGLTVAHFKVARTYRGSARAGESVSYASFKEQDKYGTPFLNGDLIVFLVRRRKLQQPPRWETATDLSEFLFTPELESKISARSKRTQ